MEDIFGGGDMDFNDLIIDIQFLEVIWMICAIRLWFFIFIGLLIALQALQGRFGLALFGGLGSAEDHK